MNKFILSLICFLFLSSPAYAYIDPGTGSFILQGIIASFLSASFAIKMYWKRLINFLKAKVSSSSNDPIDVIKTEEAHEEN